MFRGRSWRRLSVCLGVAIAMPVSACNPTTGPSTTVPVGGETWTAGDSIARGVSWRLDPVLPTVGLVGGAFISTARSPVTIGEALAAAVRQHGLPERVVLIGGVNDRDIAPRLVLAEMDTIDTMLRGAGVDVVWVTEPAWGTLTNVVRPLNAWVRDRPGSLDCAPVVADSSYTVDGVHPND